jgi:uncharacterized membrane protein YfcA
MNVSLEAILIVCPLIFLAGFIDSIAGGGGLISLPAYLAAGLPPHFALGTNKFSSTFGTFFSTIRFLKSRQMHLKSAAISAVGTLAGSFGGAKLALMFDEKALRYCMLVLLPAMTTVILFKRNFGEKDKTSVMSDRALILLSLLSGLIIGAYDGFFGPGTGTLLIFIYTGVIGFNFVTASGNTKLVNLSSNVAALLTFLINHRVAFMIGIPAAFFGIFGNWLGSGLAIRGGVKIIRPVFICILTILFIKIGYDVYTSL